MDFGFTDEQKLLRQTVRQFVARELPRERVHELDESEQHPFEIFRRMGELGWMGLPFPKQYGGTEAGAISIGILLEELAYAMLVVASGFMRTVVICGSSIYKFGSEAQREYWIGKLCNRGGFISFALTEPEAGSDAASLTTAAVEDGDDFVINGQKVFCSGAGEADVLMLAARTDPSAARHRGISIFLLDPQSTGIKLQPIRKMGMHAAHTYEIFLDDVRTPKSSLLGELNHGWDYLVSSLAMERFGISCQCTGNSQAAVDEAVDYAKKRVQFGRPIGKFQAIQHKLADMQMSVDAARLLAYRVGWMVEQGVPCNKEASMAKLFATETFMKIAQQGLQVMGGYGYTMEADMQRYFRDAKLYEIGGGSSEIQRNIIAKEMGL